jgi:molybdate/tungstate transport system permease protein
MAATATVFMLLPVAALLVAVNWSQLGQTWEQDGVRPLVVSVEASAVAMAVIVLLGTPLSWMLARRHTALWKAVEWLLVVSLLMPPLVIGLVLMYVLGPYGWFSGVLTFVHLSGSNTLFAVIIAEIYEAMPYYVFAGQAAFAQVDPAVERTSLALGRTPLYTALRVTLPLALPGLSAAFAMAFARAIGAFGAVIVVAYYPHTLPVAIWIQLSEQGLPTALPLALLLLAVAAPAPLAAFAWRRTRDVDL